jgi:hypothetical protein
MHQHPSVHPNSTFIFARILLLLAAFLALAPSTAVAQAQFPPGLRIGLTPPAGMAPSRSFIGFEDTAREASILITELAAQTYPQVARDFTPDYLTLQGMDVTHRETIALAEGNALQVVARPLGGAGPPVTKYALLALIKDVTVVVIAFIPDKARDVYTDAVVRTALASIVIRPRLPSEELISVLPFAVKELAGFRVLQASPDGHAMLTDGPADTPLPVEQPYVMISLRFEDDQTSDRETIARRALGRMAGSERFRETSAQTIRIGGRPGHEIIGEMVDRRLNVPLTVAHWVMFGTGAYIQVYAVARTDVWPPLFPRLRAIRDGVGPK